MKSLNTRPFGAAALCAASGCVATLLLGATGAARADDGPGLLGTGHWRVVGSPFAYHFRSSDEHRYVYALGIERQRDDNWLGGASYFRNSFGQPSSYTYVGKRFPQLLDRPELFGQFTAGVLYGYRGKYADKVPLNYDGFSPGAVVTLGWQFNKQLSIAAHMLGDAAVMMQLSYDLR